jgi:hypothetical protein
MYDARADALREAAPEAHNFDIDQRRPRCCTVQAAISKKSPGTAIAFKMISPAHRINSNSPSSHRTPH